MEYSASEVMQYVQENDVKFIKLLFVDIFGAVKSFSVQPSVLKRAFKEGVSFDANAVKGFLNVSKSDLFIIPDPSTLSVLPWRPQRGRVARLYCNIVYPDGTPFEGDSRRILRNVSERASEMGYDVQIGTECEFYLFKLDQDGNVGGPQDNASYCDLAPVDKGENVRRDIILNLEQMGIVPETSHHESGPGQNEIDFRYDKAMRAADNVSTFKTTVRTIAAQSGLYASFTPKPMPSEAGNGFHVNLSLHKNSQNLFAEKTLNKEAQSFIAGILSHIREITVFANPLAYSYERLGCFEAPKYVSWSRQNRSQLIRIPAAEGEQARIEVRSPDSSCNQYLVMALIIAAGLDGIEKNLPLSPAVDLDLYTASEKDLEGLEKLPGSLEEARSIAKDSTFVRSVIPETTLLSFLEGNNSNGFYSNGFRLDE